MYCFIVFAFFLSQSHVQADEITGDMQDILSLFSEEKMVITPSKYLQPINQSPSTTTIITSEDIRHSGATTIPDILRIVPGMEVMQTSTAEFNVSIRGDNQLLANKLLVLIDGRTFQEEVQNTVIWNAIPISLEEIDRIEIIRGPGSAIWGANAFDGVVNIITKRPGSMKGTIVSAAGGQVGTAIGNLIHEGGGSNINYRVSLGYSRADTLPGRDEKRLRVSVRDQGLDVTRSNGTVEYQLSSKQRVTLSGGISNLPVYDGPRFDDGWGDTDVRYDYLQVNYEGPNAMFRSYWSKHDININYYIVNKKKKPELMDVNLNSELYNIEWNYKWHFGPTHTVIGGINYRHNDAGGTFLNPDTLRPLQMTGLFLQDKWQPLKPLTITYGARYDHYATIDSTLSPRFVMLYQPVPHQTFRLSYGVAYRQPTAVELFVLIGGNTDLRHEKIRTYEAGYSTLIFHRLKGGINIFYNRLSDIIHVESDVNVNQYSIGVYGGEIDGELLVDSWLTTFLNLSQQKVHHFDVARIERNTPEYKVNGGVRLHITDALSASLLMDYVSKVQFSNYTQVRFAMKDYTDPYTLFNMQIMYSLWKEKMDFALSVFNLFHDAHREHPIGDEIGTRVLAQMTYRM
ncbi:MAG: TonB-dependent receptor [Nitrospira sp.]|nr:TonB-dependent receptor [Nitrospira sp.]